MTGSSWGWGSAAQDLLLSWVYKVRAQGSSAPAGCPPLWGKQVACPPAPRDRRGAGKTCGLPGEGRWAHTGHGCPAQVGPPSRDAVPALVSLRATPTEVTVILNPCAAPQVEGYYYPLFIAEETVAQRS